MEILPDYSNKKTFVFALDDVIYPEKDYLLQVYYLFAQFVEFSEQIPSGELMAFMKDHYFHIGAEGIFQAAVKEFNIPGKYEENLANLHRMARLPLKLLLFDEVLSLMQEIVTDRKQVILLISGEPERQLNKIKHIDWNGLEQYITVFFLEELLLTREEGLKMICKRYDLEPGDLLLVDVKN